MKRKSTISLILCLLILMPLYGCQNPGGHASTGQEIPGETPTPEPAPVEIDIVKTGTISEYLETTSNIYADKQVKVHPKIGGQVEAILVEEGDTVEKGQVLAIIDDDEYLLRVQQVEVTWNQAKEKRDRLQHMFDNQMISQEAFNDAEYAAKEAAVSYKLAKLNLRHTRLLSPISGVITERSINLGDLVTVSTNAFNIMDQNSLTVDVFFPEREVATLKTNLTAQILPDAMPNRIFNAEIQRINPVVDPKTGTIKVTLSSKGNWQELAAGMFVRVRILIHQKDHAVLIPKRALLHGKNQTTAFVMTPDYKAEERFLNLGLEDPASFEVISGVETGEQLIIVGQHSLENGQAVRLLNPVNSSPEVEQEGEFESISGSEA